ncbi:glycosyltransferase family 2 protein [Alkaliphilus peptidifermentans]|uniref:Glycosyltransferase, GT2 family n=1 Tax=Alkaliphilus peptidifermentans DSM 18978 TaxID=1120976 RepID=A0A1G5EYY8_9FIRM|nr:glycosyltransferase [Alkaliphilus peptidifermentans]SCY32206.1 Glycosyltransferase, GT2 family [Alkaliphilus peptidifermentans DSM 18978]
MFTDPNIEVSVIIPSFNRYPLNLITLYSFENQTFDFKKMEVIFIDDASVDDTYKIISKYKPPYHFSYVKCTKNFGRGKARNIGINLARGKIIIFLDAEMIVEEDFVMNHYLKHKEKNNLVLTGALHLKSVYTCIFPEFDMKQFSLMKILFKNDKELYIRLNNFIKNLEISQEKENKNFVLFNRKEILQRKYKILITEDSYFTKELLELYGKDFNFPWMAFLTGNVSIKKDLILKLGGFDIDFEGYGYEDWELGYRLYLNGAEFVADESVAGYHQEHPIPENKWNNAVNNYYLFTEKHPSIDVLILSLELARIVDLKTMNSILGEYKHLKNKYSNEFTSFQESFSKILKTTAILLKYDIRHKFLIEASGISKQEKEKLLSDIKAMKRMGEFKQLVKLFEEKLV